MRARLLAQEGRLVLRRRHGNAGAGAVAVAAVRGSPRGREAAEVRSAQLGQQPLELRRARGLLRQPLLQRLGQAARVCHTLQQSVPCGLPIRTQLQTWRFQAAESCRTAVPA
jgi:hypothetical protein